MPDPRNTMPNPSDTIIDKPENFTPRRTTTKGGPRTVLFLDHTAKMSGGEVALLGLIAALDPARYVPVVALASDGPLVEKLRALGVEVHVLPLSSSVVDTRKGSVGLKSVGQVGQVVAYAGRIARLARSCGADLIHTNSLKSDFYGGLAGRLARIPTLWHVRDRIEGGYLPGPAAAAFRVLARVVPQAVVANSQSTLDCLRKMPSPRFAVVHDGCDPDGYNDTAASDGTPPADGPVVALIGRIAPWKGQHVFIDAAASVLAAFPRALFWVVGAPLFGEHEYEAAVRAQVERLGIADRVEFLGFQDDVAAVLARTDIVVHASTHGEPFGQVVIEGMAAGKPVIATNGGALPEIVEDGVTGLLVPMGDAPALAAALCGLLTDPARAHSIGEAGRRRVRERFTLSETARKMQHVYDRLLASKNQG